jgi:hypothetical protein
MEFSSVHETVLLLLDAHGEKRKTKSRKSER